MTSPCRLCYMIEPHVHTALHHVERAYPFTQKTVTLSSVESVDFGLPALKIGGQWFQVDAKTIDEVWPEFQKSLAMRPHKDSQP